MDTETEAQQRQPEHGRHRRVSGDAVVMPEPVTPSTRRPAHARPVIPVQPRTEDPLARSGIVHPGDAPTEPLLPVTDPIADTDAVGLRKFDIGTVPASVTPPGTWKRAVWFSVGSSAAVLIGLLVVVAAVVGPAQLRSTIENFPGGQAWTMPLPSGTPSPQQQSMPGDRSAMAGPGTEGAAPGTTAPSRGGTPTSTTGSSPAGGGTGSPRPTTLPPITTVPGPTGQAVDPGKIVKQTQNFFAAVDNNIGEAYGLTTGTLRANGKAALEQRYADVSTVALKGITVDPGRALTISTVLVTRKDGSTATEEHVLRFSTDELPLISEDRTK